MAKTNRSGIKNIRYGVFVFLIAVSIFTYSNLHAATPPVDPVKNLKDVTPTASTSGWAPSSIFGWYPYFSLDGRYVAYGLGDPHVTDLQTKQTWDFSNPPDLPPTWVNNHACANGGWIKSNILSFSCYNNKTDTENIGFYRYEVRVGEWIPHKTTDDPRNAAGNITRAGDGHWIALTGARIAKDNKVLENSDGMGSPAISGDMLVTACKNNESLCIWNGFTLSDERVTETAVLATDMYKGYILYAGYDGSIHGINPSGEDINLNATSPQKEGVPIIVPVNGKPWIATTTCLDSTNKCYGLIRPWGERKSIVVSANAPYGLADAVYMNGNFVLAFQGDRGQLTTQVVPSNATRVDLCGDACTDTGDKTTSEDTIQGAGLPFESPKTIPIPNEGLPTDIGQLIEAIFAWSLSLIGIVIFIRFFYAGFLWFTSAGSTDKSGEAKKIMTNAVYGTVVLFSAYIILNSINPDFVGSNFTLPGLPGGVSTKEDGKLECDAGEQPIQYSEDVTNAEKEVLNDPTIADLDAMSRENIGKFRDAVISQLKDTLVSDMHVGHISKDCSGGGDPGSDALIIFADADEFGEVCDITKGLKEGEQKTIKEVAQASCGEHTSKKRLIK